NFYKIIYYHVSAADLNNCACFLLSLSHAIFSVSSPISLLLIFTNQQLNDLSIISPRFVFFFFSSRRRHTRSKRDWSSDVCSSDLKGDDYGQSINITKNTEGTGCGSFAKENFK